MDKCISHNMLVLGNSLMIRFLGSCVLTLLRICYHCNLKMTTCVIRHKFVRFCKHGCYLIRVIRHHIFVYLLFIVISEFHNEKRFFIFIRRTCCTRCVITWFYAGETKFPEINRKKPFNTDVLSSR